MNMEIVIELVGYVMFSIASMIIVYKAINQYYDAVDKISKGLITPIIIAFVLTGGIAFIGDNFTTLFSAIPLYFAYRYI